MDAEAYRLMARLEREHWWYRGRRALIARVLAQIPIPKGARLLDLGCGTGGNLELLGRFGRVFGVEPAGEGELHGHEAWAGRVGRARAPDLPFRDASFDLVAALDVLEHIHDEIRALDEIRRVLVPGGHVVLHVPAYAFLWGHEDVISRHLRRYRKGEIRRLLEACGFEVRHLGYTTTALFPFVAAGKIGKRLLVRGGPPRSDAASLPPRLLNQALAAIAEAEADVAASAELAFGASVLAVGQR